MATPATFSSTSSSIAFATSDSGLNTTNSTTNDVKSLSIDNLYPAIIQCFAIILVGYIAGRASWITKSQGNGIGAFVGKFCLPALLFKSMVELKFEQVNWYFLLGIALSKTIVFVLVVMLSLLIRRPMHLGMAGLFGIFATQSNDFALGYPILKAIYSQGNPEYLQYIYLIAPISLVFLNPIGFTMLEVHRRNTNKQHKGTCRLVLHVLKDVISNPMVFMVIVGIAGNFIFKQNMPTVLGDFLDVLGNAYSASALFYLGLSLVGKLKDQIGFALIVPMLLIAVKTLLLPLIMWEVIEALELHQENDTHSLSMFGFLYGTFPTAPSVFLYASQFSVAQDIVATGMVACTFLSAPLMFASAKMMTVVVDNTMDYNSLLIGTSFDLSTVALVTNIWIIAVLLLGKMHKKIPYQFLLLLVSSQVLSCIGTIIYKYSWDTTLSWQQYIQFVISMVGDFTSRCFTAVLSCIIYLMQRKSLDFVVRIRKWLYIFAVGFPVLCTSMFLLLDRNHMGDNLENSFHYGATRADVLSVVVLGTCSVLNVTFLVLHQRIYRQQSHTRETRSVSKVDNKQSYTTDPKFDNNSVQVFFNRSMALSTVNEDISDETYSCKGSQTNLLATTTSRQDCLNNYRSMACSNFTINHDDYTVYWSPDDAENDNVELHGEIEHQSKKSGTGKSHDTLKRLTESSSGENQEQLPNSWSVKRKDAQGNNKSSQVSEYCPGDVDLQNAAEQTPPGKFLVLLIFLQIAMFMSLFLGTWRLFNDSKSGIYVEIEFLDVFLNYGQSFVVFALFGFDVHTIIQPFIKRWRKLIYNVENVNIYLERELPIEEKQLCDQFVKYHRDRCAQDIVTRKKHRLKTYENVFTGRAFCDWLIEVGLCDDRGETVTYGQILLKGKVISHVTEEHNFHDMPYFYRFLDCRDNN